MVDITDFDNHIAAPVELAVDTEGVHNKEGYRIWE